MTLNVNVDNYIVEMYTDTLKTTLSTECKNKRCELIDLAPFGYIINIKKEGYKDFQTYVKIEKNKSLEVDVFLEKQIQILPQVVENTSWEDSKQKQLERLRTVSLLQKTYQYFEVPNYGYFFFQKGDANTLVLSHKKNEEEKKIYTLNFLSDDQKISLDQIYGGDDEIFFSYWQYIYIIHISSWNIQEVFFPQDISYMKKDGELYYFVNDKWTFIYDNRSKKIDFFYLFKDFIMYDQNTYFWIIFQNEEDKKKNYNLEQYKNGNLIIKYNFITKEVKVIETITKNIAKIIKIKNNIYFYDITWEKYKIENLE